MTRTMKFKLPAVILTIALLLSLCSAGVLAADDSALPASGATYAITESDSTVKIDADGVYTITGGASEGSVTVKKGVTATLILQDLTLSSSTTAPIVCKANSNVTLYIAGTVTLSDNETDESSDDYEGAAIKVKSGASLTIDGTGVLNINGSAKNGIKGAASSSITVAGATVNVSAANNGVADDNVLNVTGGTLNVTAGNEGLKASPDDDDEASLGNIFISGGTVNVTASDDGIHADGSIVIDGGTITVAAGDDAIHADGTVTINDGSINITKSYEGIEGSSVYLNGGSATVTASDDGVNAASDVNGTVEIVVNGGKWYVNAGGDGLDAGGENNRGNGSITINGGETIVFGAADNGNGALDSESGITYNGGTILAVGMSGMAEYPSGDKVLVFGGSCMGGMQMDRQTQGMNQNQGQQGQQPQQGGFGGQQMGGRRMGLMGTFTGWAPNGNGQQGGQMGGMNAQPQQGNTQMSGNTQQGQTGMNQNRQFQSAGSVSIGTGSVITICDESGNTIYTATAVKNADSVVFASDAVTSGGTYTLYVNGSAAATATAGTGAAQGQQMQQPGQQAQQGQNQQQSGNQSQQSQQGSAQAPQQGGFGGRQQTGGNQMGGMNGRQQRGGFMGR